MKPLRLLLLEDTSSDAELILRNLKKSGFEVQHDRAYTAAEMTLALENGSWDVVISDFNMPGFGALEALKILRDKNLDLPFIVVSGAVGEETAVELMKAGADDYVMKSSLIRLGPAIDRSLREAESRRKEKEAKNKAAKAILEREKMLAIVSHDMKNPLGAIALNLQLIQRVLNRPDLTECEKKILPQIRRIKNSTERLGHLINDILDYSKIEAGRFRVEKTSGSLEELVAEVVESFQPLALQKSVLLFSSLPHRIGNIYFDRERIFQVLNNLVGNAIKFTSENGTVTVGLERRVGSVLIKVTDTGAGIPEHQLPHIFEKFWQAEGAERFGTGLGLSIAKGLVEAHDGRIWAESTPGHGSTFYFTLPCPVKEESADKSDFQFISGQGKSILIIDDDEDLQEAIRCTLEESGYKVFSASDGKQGLNLLHELATPPDLILLDFNMPHMNGNEFLERQATLGTPLSNIPVLVTSAGPAVWKEKTGVMVKGLLNKPAKVGLVLETIQRCL